MSQNHKSFVIWMDHEHAKLFLLDPAGIKENHLKKSEHRHHNNNASDNHKNSDKFFHELAHQIHDATEVLLVGPGLAKTHFKHYLENHHAANLAKKNSGHRNHGSSIGQSNFSGSSQIF